jgi:hypothetical protein
MKNPSRVFSVLCSLARSVGRESMRRYPHSTVTAARSAALGQTLLRKNVEDVAIRVHAWNRRHALVKVYKALRGRDAFED